MLSPGDLIGTPIMNVSAPCSPVEARQCSVTVSTLQILVTFPLEPVTQIFFHESINWRENTHNDNAAFSYLASTYKILETFVEY